MANNSITFLTSAAIGFAGLYIIETILRHPSQDIINPDDVFGHHAGLNATAGAGGDTPGWYTLNGHHHCGVSPQGDFAAGCLCTDPKKCDGKAGTDAAYCAAHPQECWPVDKPNWCAYWYASDQKYCNLCNGPWKYVGPAGSGAKPCP